MKKYFILFAFMLSCLSEIHAQKNITLRIDPDNALGGTASQVFDSIEFIPLQTTKESLFGSIDQLEITDSFFVILDKQTYSILIFKRNGSFRTKIKGGADKYFGYFSISKDSDEIEVINYFNNTLNIYNFDGNLIRTLSCPINARALYDFYTGKRLYSLRRINRDGSKLSQPFDLAYTTGSGTILTYLKKFDQRYQSEDYNIMDDPINFSGEPGSCMFSLPYDYTVYQLNDTGIIKKFTFLFPLDYSLPPNFSTDSSFKDKREQYVYRDHLHSKIIWDINSIYKCKNYLLFSVQDLTLKVYGIRNFLYNIKNGNLLSFSRVIGDSSSFYFPFLNTTLDKVEGVFGDKIFTSLPAVRILALSKDATRKLTYPKGLDELIKTGTKINNPVIVQFRLRENL